MSALAPVDPTVEIETERDNPNIILRIVWFLLVGWWLGFWVIVAAYVCLILLITAPIGIALLDRLPRIMTLRAPARTVAVSASGEIVEVDGGKVDQLPWLVRIPWLILVGWWLGAVWLLGAYSITLFTFGLGLPISFWMFGRAGKVTTLYRG